MVRYKPKPLEIMETIRSSTLLTENTNTTESNGNNVDYNIDKLMSQTLVSSVNGNGNNVESNDQELNENNLNNNINSVTIANSFELTNGVNHNTNNYTNGNSVNSNKKHGKSHKQQRSTSNSPVLSRSPSSDSYLENSLNASDNEDISHSEAKDAHVNNNDAVNGKSFTNTILDANSENLLKPTQNYHRPQSPTKQKVSFSPCVSPSPNHNNSDTVSSTGSVKKGTLVFLKGEDANPPASKTVFITSSVPTTSHQLQTHSNGNGNGNENGKHNKNKETKSKFSKTYENTDSLKKKNSEENDENENSQLIADPSKSTNEEETEIVKPRKNKKKSEVKRSRSFTFKYNEQDKSVEVAIKNDCFTQLGNLSFYQAILAEFIGTCILVIYFCSFGLSVADPLDPVPSINACVGCGLLLSTLVWGLGNVSGANLNPAVSIALLLVGEINIVRAMAYILMQLCGALLGAYFVKEWAPPHLKGMSVVIDSRAKQVGTNIANSTLARVVRQAPRNPSNLNNTVTRIFTTARTTLKSTSTTTVKTLATTLATTASTVAPVLEEGLKSSNATVTVTEPLSIGVTLLHKDLTHAQGVGIEMIMTFILVLTIFACLDTHRKDISGSFPLTIGLALTACSFFAGPLTGGSLNPARSFGPAAIMQNWENHWIYWVGPISGAIIAAIFYKLMTFRLKSTPHKTVEQGSTQEGAAQAVV